MGTVEEIDRQIGQLLWVGYDGLLPPDGLLTRTAAGRVGAGILFRRNVSSPEQVAETCRLLHEAAPAGTPLLLCVDQEGGRVQRVREPATVWPPMLRLGERAAGREASAAEVEALAEAVGRALGSELAAMGFDLDFAPVLDVHTNAANPVIGDRAFATSPGSVVRLAGSFARGLEAAGILPCGKHFPGHGDTALDSHLALPRLDHPLSRLEEIELSPFRALVELPVMMTAHVIFAALDDALPATLSPKVVGELLRGRLGYRGVVVSDDLEMKAIADHFGLEEAVERALLAGCDAFLLCHREDLQHRAAEALARLAERSSEARGRIAESAARILALKRRHHDARPPRPGLDVLGRQAHRALAERMLG